MDSNSASVVFDAATLERIIAAAVASAVQAERAVAAEATPQPAQAPSAPQVTVLEKALSWTDFPKWPGKCDRVDAWFQSLEAKLKASRIPEEKWASKLMECPKIGDELKRRLAGLEDSTYEGIRRHCLSTYGPVDPVGFFRSQMFSVKGTTREEVMEKLEDARALHNRAARLAKKTEWEDEDLLYPFVNAFPEAIATKLRQEMASAIRNGNPLQELVSRAPSIGDVVPEEDKGKELPLVGQVEVKNIKKRKAAEVDLVAEVQELKKLVKANRVPSQPRPPIVARRPCFKCGGTCAGSAACPASNRTCFNCGKVGHMANTCRAPRRPPRPGMRPSSQQLGMPPFMRGQDRN